MPKKKNRPHTNPDFRHRSDFPAPPVEEIQKRLMTVLTPGDFAPMRMANQKTKLRERILTLPVMTAIVVSLVWRQIPSLCEVLRILAKEGLLWVRAIKVSKQALSKRLEKLPASLFAQVFEDVILRIRNSRDKKESLSLLVGQESWQKVKEYFRVIWIADGSTLEALKKKMEGLRDKTAVCGGKMMMVVEAFSHVTVCAFYTDNSGANDKIFVGQLLGRLPVGGLMVFDLGFFSFPFFDAFSEGNKYFVTRLREKTAYRVVGELSRGQYWRDEIIEMGKYRSNPCKWRVRKVSVQWKGRWYCYITNVIDSKVLSARQVCELYRRRWRIEDAFKVTKRLLGLSYLWVGSTNGVEVQIYATWIFYAVLNDICEQVAEVLNEPLERISVEMVFRGFYHYGRACERGEGGDIVGFLAENAQLLGIVKAQRKRHREAKLQQQEVWVDTLS